ncbi:hypothetical protein ACHAW6_005623 [Cyclotella cf. meneghiniana]
MPHPFITKPTDANNTLAPYRISSSFIDDAFSRRCQQHQNRPFLSVGVVPRVGMRVEVLMFLKLRGNGDICDGVVDRDGEVEEDREGVEGNMERKIRPFRLSGEVVEVRPAPSLQSPQYVLSPENGSQHTTRSVSRRITTDTQKSQAPSNPLDSQNKHTTKNKSQILLPSTSPQDSGPGRGSLFLADIVNVFVSDGQVFEHMQQPTPLMLEEWNEMTFEQKERIYNFMIERWGAVHGQEVVCEARLNFDYDIRRGSENGPWNDLIPIDGRDTWRFTLAYNDQYDDDAWHSIPNSFVNLGRNARNRCWPWTADHVLPYRRTGADAPVWGNGPGGALKVHVDLGPFLEKNVGRKRPQSFQAYAA